MLAQHKSHIVSTCSTAAQHLDEIRQLATTGKTPGGGHVAPLADQLREPLLAELDVVEAGIDALARSLIPDQGRTGPDTTESGAALMWLSILLRTVEELVRDLSPERVGRCYGALSPAESRRLQSCVDEVLGGLRAAMQLLGREEQGGSR